MSKVNLEASWLSRIGGEFEQSYLLELKAFLRQEKAAGKQIFPPAKNWFSALDSTPFDQVKVVILGQDPYHGPGQAHGLCFSVQPDTDIPPSLRNIYAELETDLGIEPPTHGYLAEWAERGVLLLNATLTVEARNAGSHQNKGWETFTDAVIAVLNREAQNLVFILWGSYAQKKGAGIDSARHLVLKAPHPSPLSSYRGFFGSRPFSTANQFLESKGIEPIDWRLSEA